MQEKGKKKENRELPNERYDRELYKQAVRAAKEAKELERKEKARKRLKKNLLFILLSILLGIGVYFLIPLFSPKEEYILSYEYPVEFKYENIVEESVSTFSNKEISLSSISAESAIAFNPVTGEILFEKAIDEKKSVASLTKLISAIVVLETFEIEETINVSTENIPEDLDWQLGLSDGDSITVENILKAMLISSYNDTAYVIANAYPYGGYEGFIKAMNRKAKDLKMNNSSFSNPAGIDEPENYSTARDIAILTSISRRYKEISDIVGLSKDIINWSSSEGLNSKEILTTNQLHGTNRYIQGLKTGITDLAGQCFAGYYVYPNGNELITVVLNSEDRFQETVLIERKAREILKR